MTFDATGTASAALHYADVGEVQLTGTYTGSAATDDTGLTMTGSTRFISSPAAFAFTAVPTGPTRAGVPFSVTLQARNSLGHPTPNFGRESTPQLPTLSHTKASPTGPGSSPGVFSGSLASNSFGGGSGTSGNLVWSEVGRIDLRADLASYLGTGTAVIGSTGTSGTTLGPFLPHHFDVVATPACSSPAGDFTYAGQPFTVTVTAMNGLPTPTRTVNHDGSALSPALAKAVTLSDAAGLGLGSFGATASVAASRFSLGIATTAAPTYTYSAKRSAPGRLTLRATDPDGVTSSGHAEPGVALRSGRLVLFPVYGSEKTGLSMPVQAQHWSGRAWVLNDLDHGCTSVAATSIVRTGYLDHQGSAGTAWTTTASAFSLSGGRGSLTLSAPSPTGSTGSVDIALNLGSTTTDASCLSSHPASMGANLPWLRSLNGSCATTWDRDPAARASFGIASPETKKTLHVRELY
jgi:MSHA biogenesis protein MshQ